MRIVMRSTLHRALGLSADLDDVFLAAAHEGKMFVGRQGKG